MEFNEQNVLRGVFLLLVIGWVVAGGVFGLLSGVAIIFMVNKQIKANEKMGFYNLDRILLPI